MTESYLEFADNQLLTLLFGQRDAHLNAVSRAAGVQIQARGNRVMIRGEAAGIEAARTILEQLYARAKVAQALAHHDIDNAIISVLGNKALVDKEVPAATPRQTEITTYRKTIVPRSAGQAEYIDLLHHKNLVFALGPAGTGKTYLAAATGVAMLLQEKVDRIIMSRPAVEAGEKLGYLPGDMREKVDPYLRPLYDALYDMLPADHVKKSLEKGEIEVAPLAFMRGRTLANAYVILDEAQNTTVAQMRMFLTRMGKGSHMVITGDTTQIDLPAGQASGLTDAARVLQGISGIGFINLQAADIVRHPLVGKIVEAYEHDIETHPAPRHGGR